MKKESVKNLVIVGLSLIIIVMAIIIFADNYQVFHSDLSQNEMTYMCKTLEENSIAYKLKGNQILVKENQLVEANKLFDGYTWNETFTDKSEKRKESLYLVMAEEISDAIESLDDVQKAEVSLMISENAGNKASCLLTMHKDNSLDESQINGLVTFIKGSVDNLEREDIIVMDSDFNVLFSEKQE
ncbi:hypothetical protein EZV73_23620 [Acidaminobacter sp. JC074]|uniref:hypothetical protein n=1 Tax=Acidaminobacter sp. JC074 TaxID=2530199 RepID=UPI001F0F41CB|nr:hypothetical protein [Acidaminobacter sp. JC074]MCH4890591.1 hypothetical protein [Acidaminobacter sp. JC074]